MEILLFFISALLFLISSNSNAEETSGALFIFGDSTVDVGNNNFIDTIPPFKANYPPYGKKGFPENPTGRFGEGRVIVDFIAEYAGLPLIPPYGDSEADFSRGANFASGGAGALPETNLGMVIDLRTQLQHFDELQQSLSEKIGYIKTRQLLSDAIYFISIGSNDYLSGYLSNPTMQDLFEAEHFVAMVVGNLSEAIQVLYSKGARRVAYLGIGPLGCIPILRAIAKDPNGGCLATGSALAQAHNIGFSSPLRDLQINFPDMALAYGNFFNFLTARMEDPPSHGFKEAFKACCGSGPYRGEFTCGKESSNDESYEVCNDPSEHIWWDAYHPCERIHQEFAKAMWNGSSHEVEPTNVSHLFKSPSPSSLPLLCSSSEDKYELSAQVTPLLDGSIGHFSLGAF